MDNTPDSPAKTPVGYTTQGGNFWTLITPEIWKVLHAVLHLNVLVCSAQPPGAAAGQVFGPSDSPLCPPGSQAYLVESYVPFSSSQAFIDGLMSPFDTSIAAGIFGFAFGIVVFFWLLGLKGSVILKPFWGGYR